MRVGQRVGQRVAGAENAGRGRPGEAVGLEGGEVGVGLVDGFRVCLRLLVFGECPQEVTEFQGGVRESGKKWTSPSGMEDRDGKPCMAQQKGCYLVLRIPADLTGKAYLRLGRQANPGEAYDEDGEMTATTKGGSLTGYRVDEKTVGEVVPEIEKRGLKVTYLIMTVGPGNPGGFGIDPDKQSAPVGKDWIVWEAEEAAPDTVRLLVTDKRYDKNPVYGGPRDNVITD